MVTLLNILKSSRVLAAAITGAVVVTAVYQFVVQKYVDTGIVDVLAVLTTYWLGVFTPAPSVIKDNE